MQLLYQLLLLIGTIGPTFSQAVTTQPDFSTADAAVTLIFDCTLSKNNRTSGLLGKTNDVYHQKNLTIPAYSCTIPT